MAEKMNKTTKESICHEWSKGNDDSINMDQWIQCKSSSIPSNTKTNSQEKRDQSRKADSKIK